MHESGLLLETLRSADHHEEVEAAGEADDDGSPVEQRTTDDDAPVERPGEIATVQVDMTRSSLRRGMIANVTTALDAAQRAVEDALAFHEAGLARYAKACMESTTYSVDVITSFTVLLVAVLAIGLPLTACRSCHGPRSSRPAGLLRTYLSDGNLSSPLELIAPGGGPA